MSSEDSKQENGRGDLWIVEVSSGDVIACSSESCI
jgi:hypothetical protein